MKIRILISIMLAFSFNGFANDYIEFMKDDLLNHMVVQANTPSSTIQKDIKGLIKNLKDDGQYAEESELQGIFPSNFVKKNIQVSMLHGYEYMGRCYTDLSDCIWGGKFMVTIKWSHSHYRNVYDGKLSYTIVVRGQGNKTESTFEKLTPMGDNTQYLFEL